MPERQAECEDDALELQTQSLLWAFSKTILENRGDSDSLIRWRLTG